MDFMIGLSSIIYKNMTTITIQSTSPEVTFKLGQVIGKWLSGREGLIFLTGDIGAGKTAISKGIVFGYGYSGRVTSPTFALINRYDLDNRSIFHMDLYRLSDIDELYEIGFDEISTGHYPVLVEWPEIINNEGYKPQIIIDIMRTADHEKRLISLTSTDKDFIDQMKAFEKKQSLSSV